MSGAISASSLAMAAATAIGGALLSGAMADKPSAPTAPTVTQDADKAAADAASSAMQQRTAKRRAYRAQSLLASGSGGDQSNVITGAPTATAGGKTTLGG